MSKLIRVIGNRSGNGTENIKKKKKAEHLKQKWAEVLQKSD